MNGQSDRLSSLQKQADAPAESEPEARGETGEGTNPGGQYLSFTLGEEDYGVDILKVQEIRGWEGVRPLPDTPEYIKGVLELRGTVIPVVDLRSRFRLARCDYTATTVVIVLSLESGRGTQVIGAVVDGVTDVLDVAADEMRPPPELGVAVNTRFIKAIVPRKPRLVVLLDVDRLFDPKELSLRVSG